MSPDFFINLTVIGAAVAILVRLYLLMLVGQRYLEAKTRLTEIDISQREHAE